MYSMAWKAELSKAIADKDIYDTVPDKPPNNYGSQTGLDQKLDSIINLIHDIDNRLRRNESRRESYGSPPPTITRLPSIPSLQSPDSESKSWKPPILPKPNSKPLPSPPLHLPPPLSHIPSPLQPPSPHLQLPPPPLHLLSNQDGE